MKRLLLFLLLAVSASAQTQLLGNAVIQQTVKFTGDITPTTLAANTDDYAPTNFSTAIFLRISSDAARDITGLAGGAEGRWIWLINVGSYSITLKNESASSVAANRFALNLDYVLVAGAAVQVIYDGTSLRWRAGGSSDSGTVSSVSVTTANGVSGSVATSTTTPAITLSLGAITPTSVAATGTVSGTNITSGGNVIGNAATVTTNANLTGDVTSVGNATTLTNAPVIAKVLTGYVSGAGTVAATDSILQAIQKLNGNNATNANLTGPITSVGNATSIASQTGTGTKFVVDTSPVLVTPTIGAASATSLTLTNGATITDPATGAIALTASGTNQNVTLTASGSGNVVLGSTRLRTASPNDAILLSGAGTSPAYMKISTTGGNAYVGVANSAGGGILSGAGNYSLQLGTETTNNVALGTNNSARLIIDGTTGNVSVNTLFAVGPSAATASIGILNSTSVTAASALGTAYKSSGTITTAANNDGIWGARIDNAYSNAGAFTNVSAGHLRLNTRAFTGNAFGYGLSIGAITGATTNYAIRSEGAGLVAFADTTASTSTTTGAVTTAGGLGVAGAGYFGAQVSSNNGTVNQRIIASGTAGYAGTSTSHNFILQTNSSDRITINATTGDTSVASTADATGVAATGALQTAGGIFASKNIVSGTGFLRYKSANGTTGAPVSDLVAGWVNTNAGNTGAGMYALNSLTSDSSVWLKFRTNTTAGTTTDALAIDAAQAVLAVSPTGGLGYGTGAGGTVTQATSRTTGVTLNKVSGEITLISAAGTATWQSFTVTNSAVAATDRIILNQKSGTDLYLLHVTNVAAGSFRITFATTGGTTTETPVIGFTVIKSVSS